MRVELPSLLRECIETGIEGFVPVDTFLRVKNPTLFERLARLRIHSIGRYNPGSGKVYFGMTGYGGAVDPTGREVPKWIGEFLGSDDRRDVLVKLRASAAAKCHVFVHVSLVVFLGLWNHISVEAVTQAQLLCSALKCEGVTDVPRLDGRAA